MNDFELSTSEKFVEVNKKFDAINARLDKIEDLVEEHTNAFVQIYTFLGQKYPKKGLVFSQKFSPKSLNNLGKRVFDEIHGQDFLDCNRDYLFGYIDDNPINELVLNPGAPKYILPHDVPKYKILNQLPNIFSQPKTPFGILPLINRKND